MKLVRTIAAGAALAWIAAADIALAQNEVQVPRDQPHIQHATGFTFPAQVNDFQRTRVTRFRPDGTDEAASYVRYTRGQEVVVTVYVYPSPPLSSAVGSSGFGDARSRACAAHFGEVRLELEGVHRNARIVQEFTPTTVQSGVTYQGHGAIYEIETPFMGRDAEVLHSQARLFCFVGGRWSVKYRISHPANYDATADIDAFMAAMPWTIAEQTL